MTTETRYARHERFLEFKADVQERLEQWLLDHPDDGTQKLLAGQTATESVTKDGKKLVVTVQPVSWGDGGWGVYKNHILIQTFYGHDAWARATSHAGDILNKES